MLIHRDALAACANATTKCTARFYRFALNCIHVLKDGTVEGTDGETLVRISGATRDAAEYPRCDGLDISAASEALLPADVVVRALRAIPKRPPFPILHALVVTQADGQPTLAVNDLTTVHQFSAPAPTIGYPNTDSLLDKCQKRKVNQHVCLSAHAWRTLLRVLDTARVRFIHLDIATDHDPVLFHGEGPEVKIQGLVMPAIDNSVR